MSLDAAKARALPQARTGRPPLYDSALDRASLQCRQKVPCKSINSLMREPRLRLGQRWSSTTRLQHRCWLRARSLALRATCARDVVGQHTANLPCTRHGLIMHHMLSSVLDSRGRSVQRSGSCWSYFVEGMGCRAMDRVVWLKSQLGGGGVHDNVFFC